MVKKMVFPYKLIDLTHTLDQTVPTWDGNCGFEHNIKLDYEDCESEYKFRVQGLKIYAGIGTHMDAPAHCFSDGLSIDQLQMSDLIAPCRLIDASNKADENYSISTQDLIEHEKAYGKIEPNSFIMIRTGWERFWNDPEKYRNNLVFPSVSAQAAQYMLEKEIVGLGIDTLSLDRPKDGFPVHSILLGAGKYIVENAANLHALPVSGSFIMTLPIKIKGGTEAPIRLVAFVNRV